MSERDWQPISTAPMDGSIQWVARRGPYAFADFMRFQNGRWEFSDGSWLAEGSGVTDWHPLPQPPSIEDESSFSQSREKPLQDPNP